MDKSVISKRSFSILSGLSGMVGVVLIIVSFAINNGPPPGATSAARAGRPPYFKAPGSIISSLVALTWSNRN